MIEVACTLPSACLWPCTETATPVWTSDALPGWPPLWIFVDESKVTCTGPPDVRSSTVSEPLPTLVTVPLATGLWNPPPPEGRGLGAVHTVRGEVAVEGPAPAVAVVAAPQPAISATALTRPAARVAIEKSPGTT